MAKARKQRTQYTAEQREKILAAAKAEKLTALQVQKKFGVTPVTYYSWRKKTGIARPRGGSRFAGAVGGGTVDAQVRGEVQQKIRQILPGIVRSEVSAYLDSVFARGGRRRGRRRA